MSDTLCGYPWLGAAIRPNGNVIPCCQFTGKSSHVSKDFRSDWQQIREDMLAGKKITGCEECYQKEASGFKSMRLTSLEYYKPTDSNVLPLTQLEVAFNNLCNLACVHCNNEYSTKWYTEDIKAGRIKKTSIVEHDFEVEDLSNLKSLKLIGGEPMMVQDKCIRLLEKCNLSNIRVFIATNGTTAPNDKLRSLLEQCSHVTIALSLDSLYTVNDWFRWPSKFNDIVDVMKTYESWNANNILLRVHSVINAYNVMYVPEFEQYIETHFPNWDIEWDWLRVPAWQTVSVLPSTVKQELINTIAHPVTQDRLRDVPTASWTEFKQRTMDLAKERDLDFLQMVDKFNSIWNLNE